MGKRPDGIYLTEERCCNGNDYSFPEMSGCIHGKPFEFIPYKNIRDMTDAKPNKELHDQIIHFRGGEKKLIQNVRWVFENEMVHLVDDEGIEYIINKANVNFIERRMKPKSDETI